MMKYALHTVLGLAVLALAACRSDPNRELIERELRMQEDEIYRLEDELQEHCDLLEACRREKEDLERRLGGDDVSAAPSLGVPRGGATEPSQERDYLDEAPRYDVPMPDQPSGEAEPPGGIELHAPQPEIEVPFDDEPPALSPTSASMAADGDHLEHHQVDRITLNRTLTGGLDLDDSPGHDGIQVVVEPRDAGGRIVNAPAELAVVVLDPAREGKSARIARWDFTSDEAAKRFRREGLAGGIHLTLAWPSQPPTNTTVLILVRYVLPDGQRLVAEKQIQFQPPASRPSRWTDTVGAARRPRTSPRGLPNAPADPAPRVLAGDRVEAHETQPESSPAVSSPPIAEKTRRRPTWSPYR